MTLKTLIRRSLRFHMRSHLGVIAGVAMGGAALTNQVTIIGVEDPAWPEMAGWTRAPQTPSWFNQWRRGGTALISETLARQLHAAAGDEIIARIRKPSALGLDAALSPKNDNTI